MENRDYIVLIDENGQPYIAHAWGKGTAHKYIKKIGEGAKARYFYTRQELEAFYNQGKTKVGQAADKVKTAAGNAAASVRGKVRDVVGYTARENRDKAHANLVNARAQDRGAQQLFEQNYAKEQAAAKRRDAVAKNANAAYSEAERAAKLAEITARGARQTSDVLDKQSQSAAKSAAAATTDAERAAKIAEINARGAKQTQAEVDKQWKAAWDQYRAGSRGTLDKIQGLQARHFKAEEDVKNKSAEAERAAKIAEITARGAKQTSDVMEKQRQSAAKSAEAATSEADRAAKIAEINARGAKQTQDIANKEYEKAHKKTSEDLKLWNGDSDWNKSDTYYGNNQRAYDKAEADYAKTPLAKIEELKTWGRQAANTISNYANGPIASIKAGADKVKEAASSAADKVKGAASAAKEKAKDTYEKARDAAINKAEDAMDKASNISDSVKDKVSTITDDIKDYASYPSNAAGKVKDAASSAAGKVKGAASAAYDKVKGAAASAKASASSTAASIKSGYDSIVSEARAAGIDVKEFASSMAALTRAESNYKKIMRNSNSSSTDKIAAKQVLNNAKRTYNAELNDVLNLFGKGEDK